MTPVTPISNASTSSSLETIALLQAQMLRYSQMANAASGPASSDYIALQAAIKSGNVSEAQTALFRLQRDSQAASSSATSSAATTSANSSPVDSDGDHDGSTGTVASSTEHSLNETA